MDAPCVSVFTHMCSRVRSCVHMRVSCVCAHGSAVGRFFCGHRVCKHRAVGLCAHACVESGGFVCRYVSVHTHVLCVPVLSAGCVCVCVGVPSGGAVRACVRACVRAQGTRVGQVLSRDTS